VKRNPQDATLRNIRALKKRVQALESQLGYIPAALFAYSAASRQAAEQAWRRLLKDAAPKKKGARR
jgi:hypothetical protein